MPKSAIPTGFNQGQIGANQVIGLAQQEESKEEEKVPDIGQIKKVTMSLSQENTSKEMLTVRELDANQRGKPLISNERILENDLPPHFTDDMKQHEELSYQA